MRKCNRYLYIFYVDLFQCRKNLHQWSVAVGWHKRKSSMWMQLKGLFTSVECESGRKKHYWEIFGIDSITIGNHSYWNRWTYFERLWRNFRSYFQLCGISLCPKVMLILIRLQFWFNCNFKCLLDLDLGHKNSLSISVRGSNIEYFRSNKVERNGDTRMAWILNRQLCIHV